MINTHRQSIITSNVMYELDGKQKVATVKRTTPEENFIINVAGMTVNLSGLDPKDLIAAIHDVYDIDPIEDIKRHIYNRLIGYTGVVPTETIANILDDYVGKKESLRED